MASSPDQFLVKALGGVGINAAPTAIGTGFSVFGSLDVGGCANVFLRQNQADRGGILMSASDATAGGNNAALAILARSAPLATSAARARTVAAGNQYACRDYGAA